MATPQKVQLSENFRKTCPLRLFRSNYKLPVLPLILVHYLNNEQHNVWKWIAVTKRSDLFAHCKKYKPYYLLYNWDVLQQEFEFLYHETRLNTIRDLHLKVRAGTLSSREACFGLCIGHRNKPPRHGQTITCRLVLCNCLTSFCWFSKPQPIKTARAVYCASKIRNLTWILIGLAVGNPTKICQKLIKNFSAEIQRFSQE